MDKVRDILLFFSAGMAVFALICAIYQAMHEKNTSAGVLGTIFVACTLIAFLPKLEVLEALGVKAHLTKTLNEADEILKRLREVAMVNAKAVYLNVGKGSRWDGKTRVETQLMLDEVDQQLKLLNVPESERRSLASAYLKIMGFDLYMLYAHTLQRYFQFWENELIARLNKDSNNPQRQEDLNRWREGQRSWKYNNNLYSQLDNYSLEDELNRTDAPWLDTTQQKALQAFRNQIIALFKASQLKGSLTREAAEYLDRYSDLGGQDKKIIELFNFNPSELR